MNHGVEDGEDDDEDALIEDAIHESLCGQASYSLERGRCRACVGNVAPHSNNVREFRIIKAFEL